MDKLETFSRVVIDTTRPLLIYIFVGVYVYVGIMGVVDKQMSASEFINGIEPHVGMMIAFMFGERAALKRPDDGVIHDHMQNIMNELGQIKASTTGANSNTTDTSSSSSSSSTSTDSATVASTNPTTVDITTVKPDTTTTSNTSATDEDDPMKPKITK
jgi:hypothetical protein